MLAGNIRRKEGGADRKPPHPPARKEVLRGITGAFPKVHADGKNNDKINADDAKIDCGECVHLNLPLVRPGDEGKGLLRYEEFSRVTRSFVSPPDMDGAAG